MNLIKGLRYCTTFAGCALIAAAVCGCGSGGHDLDQQAARQEAEIRRLQEENQAIPQARAENEELKKLRSANQELPRLRSQHQEIARLNKENEQLEQQLARLRQRSGQAPAPAPAVAVAPPPEVLQSESAALPAEDPLLHEGDEILVPPQELQRIMPHVNWDNLDPNQAVAIRSLIEADGVPLTNVAQLRQLGLTNFVIKRAQTASPGALAPQ
jgi:hypothetical protein